MEQKESEREQGEEKKQSHWGFRGKTVWNWLELLIVPAALAVVGLWFAAQQDARQQEIESKRAEAARNLEEQVTQDEALQAYLDQMSQLVLERNLLEAEEESPVYTLAQARTSTVLNRLDSEHSRSVTNFLTTSGLTRTEETSVGVLKGIVVEQAALRGASLEEADLRGARLVQSDLSYANLERADLSRNVGVPADRIATILADADLSHASLERADLSGIILYDADLSDADLPYANLSGAGLQRANLNGAFLAGANMSGAVLMNADLSNAYMHDANLEDISAHYLEGADLSGADLEGVQGITEAELESVKSLEGATMPDGSKHP